jgi:hypothetical protein
MQIIYKYQILQLVQLHNCSSLQYGRIFAITNGVSNTNILEPNFQTNKWNNQFNGSSLNINCTVVDTYIMTFKRSTNTYNFYTKSNGSTPVSVSNSTYICSNSNNFVLYVGSDSSKGQQFSSHYNGGGWDNNIANYMTSFRIYNKVLTSTDITNIYAGSFPA